MGHAGVACRAAPCATEHCSASCKYSLSLFSSCSSLLVPACLPSLLCFAFWPCFCNQHWVATSQRHTRAAGSFIDGSDHWAASGLGKGNNTMTLGAKLAKMGMKKKNSFFFSFFLLVFDNCNQNPSGSAQHLGCWELCWDGSMASSSMNSSEAKLGTVTQSSAGSFRGVLLHTKLSHWR